jgi:hypothetical protein
LTLPRQRVKVRQPTRVEFMGKIMTKRSPRQISQRWAGRRKIRKRSLGLKIENSCEQSPLCANFVRDTGLESGRRPTELPGSWTHRTQSRRSTQGKRGWRGASRKSAVPHQPHYEHSPDFFATITGFVHHRRTLLSLDADEGGATDRTKGGKLGYQLHSDGVESECSPPSFDRVSLMKESTFLR